MAVVFDLTVFFRREVLKRVLFDDCQLRQGLNDWGKFLAFGLSHLFLLELEHYLLNREPHDDLQVGDHDQGNDYERDVGRQGLAVVSKHLAIANHKVRKNYGQALVQNLKSVVQLSAVGPRLDDVEQVKALHHEEKYDLVQISILLEVSEWVTRAQGYVDEDNIEAADTEYRLIE